jgi:transposase
MDQTKFYEKLLGLDAPWYVADVQLDVPGGEVSLVLGHMDSSWCCPECSSPAPVYDHARQKTWRHLDTCQLKTFLKARLPRVECPSCGVRQVDVPWAEPGVRFTLMMESFIIATLGQCETVKGGATLARTSWSAAMGVMRRAVARGLAARGTGAGRHIGVDEKAYRKHHKYMTLVYDLKASAVLYVGEDRKEESLSAYYQGLDQEDLAGIGAVAMDMWKPYFNATTAHVPGAEDKIVFDRFHIAQHMGKALDKVRRNEHKEMQANGDTLLKGTRYDWLAGMENVPAPRRARFRELRSLNLKTSRAWAIKETLRGLWSYRSKTWAKKFFDRWYAWAARSRLEPVKEVARMVKRNLTNILTYCEHGITNAVAEGLNSRIMSIKRQSSGFANVENFKTAIYFYCGNLQLDPLKTA